MARKPIFANVTHFLGIVLVAFLGSAPIGASSAGTDINFEELKTGKGPVVFLVNGNFGCNPCIARSLYNRLRKSNIDVYDLDWNDPWRRKQSTNLNLSDKYFISEMIEIIRKIPEDRPIVMIGHSFGGDSILKLAHALKSDVVIADPVPLQKDKEVALLAVLDGVAYGGKRTREPVGSNVNYFFNRWTRNPSTMGGQRETGAPLPPLPTASIPVDPTTSGNVPCSAKKCDQEEQSVARTLQGRDVGIPFPFPTTVPQGNLTTQPIYHGGKHAIYNDAYIQNRLYDLVLAIDKASRSPSSRPSVSERQSPCSTNRAGGYLNGYSSPSSNSEKVTAFANGIPKYRILEFYTETIYGLAKEWSKIEWIEGGVSQQAWVDSIAVLCESNSDMRLRIPPFSLGDKFSDVSKYTPCAMVPRGNWKKSQATGLLERVFDAAGCGVALRFERESEAQTEEAAILKRIEVFNNYLMTDKSVRVGSSLQEVQKRYSQASFHLQRNELTSAKGIDYLPLSELLGSRRWKDANRMTSDLLLRAGGSENQGYLIASAIRELPCPDLISIDSLWVNNSSGHFGLSVQSAKVNLADTSQWADNIISNKLGWSADQLLNNWEKLTDGVAVKSGIVPDGFLPFRPARNGGTPEIGGGGWRREMPKRLGQCLQINTTPTLLADNLYWGYIFEISNGVVKSIVIGSYAE